MLRSLILSRPKTESMEMNCVESTTKSESLVSQDEDKIKKVLEFKYLGVMLSPKKPTRLIEYQVAFAIAKFHELRKVLRNGRISVKSRGRYLNLFAHSRLCCNIATGNNPEQQSSISSRSWIPCGTECSEKWWKMGSSASQLLCVHKASFYVYINDDLLRITGCQSISTFAEKQQLSG